MEEQEEVKDQVPESASQWLPTAVLWDGVCVDQATELAVVLAKAHDMAAGDHVKLRFKAPDTTSSSPPRMAGCASLKSSQRSSSVRRTFSSMTGKVIGMHRSCRSPRSASDVMPFRMTGRCTSKRLSSASEYNWRVPSPPPVESLQRASDSQTGKLLKLSRPIVQEFRAAITRSCSLRGCDRSGAIVGSTQDFRTRAAVDFAEPDSPCRAGWNRTPWKYLTEWCTLLGMGQPNLQKWREWSKS